MKFSLVILALLVTDAAQAGDWLFPQPEAQPPVKTTRAASVPRPTAATSAPLPPRRPTLAAATAAKPAARIVPVKSCSANFDEASRLIKAVHGPDADLARLGTFGGKVESYTSQNRFKKSGGSILLNMEIAGMITTDVPVTICRNGNRVSVTVVTSKAREAGSLQPNQAIQQVVASNTMPGSIVLDISRSRNTLSFAGVANGTQIQASAALR